jgi:hypothetical protein
MAIRERKKAKLQLDRNSERPSHFMRLWPRVNPYHDNFANSNKGSFISVAQNFPLEDSVFRTRKMWKFRLDASTTPSSARSGDTSLRSRGDDG